MLEIRNIYAHELMFLVPCNLQPACDDLTVSTCINVCFNQNCSASFNILLLFKK
jgi:hypothetical protein